MQREVVRADPAVRRKAILLALGIVVVLTGALVAAPRLFVGLSAISVASPGEAVLLFAAFVVPILVMVMVVGVEVTRRSVSTLRERRFPPRGMPVLRDTPVIEGAAARALGVLGCTLATMLLVLGLALAVTSYRIGRVLWFGCPQAAPDAVASPGALAGRRLLAP